MADDVIEHTLHVSREVKVYRIPPRPAAGGHSSGTWRVDDCIFTGRLRMLAKGERAEIRLEDSSTGDLFALSPFTPATQSVVIEATVDSSRYYVLRVEDPSTGRHAFLGIGFSDRGAAFDFNAAVADHAKQCLRERLVASHAAAAPAPAAGGCSTAAAVAAAAGSGGWQDPDVAALYKDPGDLSLKEGQTIRIDVKRPTSRSGISGFLARTPEAGGLGLRASSDGSGGGSGSMGGAAPVLPPPPVVLPPPAQAQHTAAAPQPAAGVVAAAAAVSSLRPPTTVTVASSEENWATFD